MSEPITFVPRQTAVLAGSKKFPFDIRVLSRTSDRREVFGLRYRAYRDAWGIPEDASEQFSDSHDDLDSSLILAAYDAGVCVGALRLCFSQPWNSASNLPCAALYPGVVGVKNKAAGTLLEISRLSIDPDITNTSYRTTLYAALVRAAFIAAQAANVATLLVATKADWVKFYQYMLGFETIGEPAVYPPLVGPVSLLGASIGEAHKRQKTQNAFFRITPDEIASMRSVMVPMLDLPAAA
jgi:N-acyl-L-homoserine lactone synthetase